MPSLVNFKIIDHSGEYSNVGMNIPTIDEVSWVATETAIAGLQAALLALTAGNIAWRSLTAYNVPVNDNYPANEFAQRETGLRLFYKDTVNGKKFHITIPAPDLALVAEEGSDHVDMTVSVVDAIVTAMEALMVSPYGNSVTFYKGTIVGRRN